MILGIISDTHGHHDVMKRALSEMGKVDAYLHAGDHYSDGVMIEKLTGKPVYAVVGNCDHRENGPKELLLEFEGKRILLTHGHTYNVKYGYHRLYFKAMEAQADAVVFGHTHHALNHMEGDLLLFNPGSPYHGRGALKHSYGIMTINGHGIEAELKELR